MQLGHLPARLRVGASLLAVVSLVLGAGPIGATAAQPASKAATRPGGVARPGGVTPKVDVGTPILTGYKRPVALVFMGPHSRTAFVVEQSGRIRRAKYNQTTHTWAKAGLFLDIRDIVLGPEEGSGEQGLLGLAFAPDFDSSGLFYVYYTAASNGNDILAEFHKDKGLPVDPATRRQVLRIKDPFDNHNGGGLLFHGEDLYISDGDGGGGGDPNNNAQSLNTRLGKILRINPKDPDGPNGPLKYSVPVDNPFVNDLGAKPEIWSYGLRNPWRYSADSLTGDLWIGDVGQCQFEEIDHAGDGKGVNFGWRQLEGTHVFNTSNCKASEPTCVSDCQTLPVAEYSHTYGCAVIGGWVYRGTAYPAWYGRYLYGDICSGRMWIVNADGAPGTPTDVTPDTFVDMSAFAQDAAGELYAVELGGSIYRLALTGAP